MTTWQPRPTHGRWSTASKYRVAYCMHEGDFPRSRPAGPPRRWASAGHRDAAKKEKAVDQVIFSPACVPVEADPQLGFGW